MARQIHDYLAMPFLLKRTDILRHLHLTSRHRLTHYEVHPRLRGRVPPRRPRSLFVFDAVIANSAVELEQEVRTWVPRMAFRDLRFFCAEPMETPTTKPDTWSDQGVGYTNAVVSPLGQGPACPLLFE